MRKHCVTLGEAVGSWHIIHNAELSLYDNGKTTDQIKTQEAR